MKTTVFLDSYLHPIRFMHMRKYTCVFINALKIFLEMSTPHQILGVQSNSFPSFNKLLGGHRKGELTILTGSTGIGKTYALVVV